MLLDGEEGKKGEQKKKEVSRVELYERERARLVRETGAEMEEYLERLKPFIGMTVGEAQLPPKYPISNIHVTIKQHYRESRWSSDDCAKVERNNQASSQFISPDNKGFP